MLLQFSMSGTDVLTPTASKSVVCPRMAVKKNPLRKTDASMVASTVYVRFAPSWNSAIEITRWRLVISSGRLSTEWEEDTNTSVEEDDAMSKNLNYLRNTQVIAVIIRIWTRIYINIGLNPERYVK